MRIILASLLALTLSAPASAAKSDTIEGRASVVDGDTLAIEGSKARIRLYGIDTPESKQTCDDASGKRYLCGSRAAEVLAELIGRNGRVTCTEQDRDRYGRIVAECELPDGAVVNRAMVASGWALEYDDYSDGRYADAEADAKAARRGIWQGRFVEPSKWRKGERLATETPVANGPGKCQIKGNISGSGKIYHLPGSRTYAKTQISEKKGERWFCSESEAKAAGWRAARG